MPSLTSVSPSPVPASDSAQTIELFGSNFVSGDTVTFTDTGGQVYADEATTFVSSTELTNQFDDADDSGTWKAQINSPSGSSSTINFTVAAAQPTLSSVSPSPVPASNSAQTIELFGSNFVSGDTVTFTDTGGQVYADEATTFVSSTELTNQFDDADDSGIWKAQINSPSGSSSTINFTVAAAQPTLSSVSPSPVPASNSAQTIELLGSNFVSGDTVTFTDTGGQVYADEATTFVSSTELTNQFDDADDSGTWKAQINSPSGNSSTIFFTVAAAQPAPTLSSVSPSPAPASNSAQTIELFGSNFVSGDTVTFTDTGGQVYADEATTFVSSTELTNQFDDADDSGTWKAQINSPSGSSSTINFTVAAAQPTLSSVSPSPVPASNSAQTIELFGSNFVSGDTVTFTDTGGQVYADEATTFVSSTELTNQFDDADDSGIWQAQINSPSGSSSTINFTVAAAQPTLSSVSPSPVPASNSAQTIELLGSNFVSGDTVTFTDTGGQVYADEATTFVSSTELTNQFDDADDSGTWKAQINSPSGSSSTINFTVQGQTTPPPAGGTEQGIDYRLGASDASALTGISVSAIESDEYSFVGEYIGNATDDGYLTNSDAGTLSQNNISIVSIFERSPTTMEYFTSQHADSDAQDAVTAAENVVDQPKGTTIYFTIDPAEETNVYIGEGPLPQAYISAIDNYFIELNTDLVKDGTPYEIGVYGPGDALTSISSLDLSDVDYYWVDNHWGGTSYSSPNIERNANGVTGSPTSIGTTLDTDTAFGSSFGQWPESVTSVPTINSITASQSSGSDLDAGKTISFTVNVSENVTVNGTPLLTLNDNESASYQSGSGNEALTFGYRVQPGDNIGDLQVTGLNLNGGSIVDASSNALSLSNDTKDTGIAIDTTAPSVAITSSGGTVTNASQTVAGTGEAGTAITVFGGSTQIGTATVNGSGNWSTGVTLADQGANSITAQDTDAAGNVGTSNAVTYTLTSAPTPPSILSIVSTPASGSDLDAGKTVSFTVNVSEAVTVSGNPLLMLSNNLSAVYSGGTGTDEINFSYAVKQGDDSVDLLVIGLNPNGGSITDSSGDVLGLSYYSEDTGIVIDTTAPSVAITSSGGTVSSASQTIAGTGEANTTVTVLDGSTQIGTAVVNGSGNWSTGVTLADQGANSITAQDTDAAGNVGTSNAVTYTLTSAPTPPSILSIVSTPASGSDLDAGKTVSFTVNVSEAVTVSGNPLLMLSNNLSAVYSGGTGTDEINFSYAVKQGDNSVDLLVIGLNPNGGSITDSSGDVLGLSYYSEDTGIVIDTTAPSVAITSSGGTVTNASQTVAGTGEAGTAITVFDGSTQIGTTTVNRSGNWSTGVTLADQGANSITAQDTDAAGNVGTSTAVTYTLTTTFIGTSGSDTFHFTASGPGSLTSADTVEAGAGFDYLVFTTAGTIAASAFANVSGIDQIDLTGSGNRLTVSDAMVTQSDNRALRVSGASTSGGLTINASQVLSGDRVVVIAGSGVATLTGGAGNDVFEFAAANLTASDIVKGGTGRDTLVFTKAGTIAGSAFTHVTGIDAIDLASGTNKLTLSNALVTHSDDGKITIAGGTGTDTIVGWAVGAGKTVVFNGSTTAKTTYIAGAGTVDLISGTGNDVFEFAAANLTASDIVKGGTGRDTLVFTKAGTIAGSAFTHVTGIDAIDLASGTNKLTLSNALVTHSDDGKITIAGGTGTDTIVGWAVGAGKTVVFNGSTTAKTTYIAGAGTVDLTGGAGNDVFEFAAANLTASDIVKGGTGRDTLVFTKAGTIAGSAFTHVTGIDAIDLASGTNKLTLSNALVTHSDDGKITIAGGTGTDTIVGWAVGAGKTVVFNGSTTAKTTYIAGAGTVDLISGTGNDVFEFAAANLTASDIVKGGTGRDTLVFTKAGTIAGSAFTHVTGIDAIDLASGTNKLTLSNALVAHSDADKVTITGAAGDDTIDAAAIVTVGTVVFNGDGGADAITGGKGDNIYDFNNIAGQTLSINNAFTGGTAAHGQLDFGAGITDKKLWFEKSGNNLVADVIGTSEQVTIKNWFGANKSAQVSEIAAGGLKLDSQVQQLVQAMATYSANNPGFNPVTATTMPIDTTLQDAVAAAWHH